MSIDIFISYERNDQKIARRYASALIDHGFSIWWDDNIPVGRDFTDEIEIAIDTAKCVLVLWSHNSVKSKWVKKEAHEGESRDILVPVYIENVKKLPLSFRTNQTTNMVEWNGNKYDPTFLKLVQSIKHRIQQTQKLMLDDDFGSLHRPITAPPNIAREISKTQTPLSKQKTPATDNKPSTPKEILNSEDGNLATNIRRSIQQRWNNKPLVPLSENNLKTSETHSEVQKPDWLQTNLNLKTALFDYHVKPIPNTSKINSTDDPVLTWPTRTPTPDTRNLSAEFSENSTFSTGSEIVDAEIRKSLKANYFCKEQLNEITLLDFSNSKIKGTDLKALHLLTELEYLDLSETSIADSGLKELRTLKKLQELYLEETNIHDKGLKYLEALIELNTINLNNTYVSSEGLTYLLSLENLRSLNCSYTAVDDAGLEILGSLTSLDNLDLGFTLITNHGLKQLKYLDNLENLNLSKTRINSAGIKYLQANHTIRSLCLANTGITDIALKHLQSFDELNELILDGTKITNSGLKHLYEIPTLKILSLHNTRVTNAGVEALQKQLPDLDIENSVNEAG